MQYNNMAAVWNLYLNFGLMAVTKEPLELGIWDLVCWLIMNIYITSVLNVFYKSSVENMAVVWIFDFVSVRLM
jgi:hypothetical protein